MMNKERGVVLIIALFIVALVASLAYIMLGQIERDTRRILLITRAAQAEGYAQGSVAWAIDQLRNDWQRRKNDQVVDAIPIKAEEIVMNGYHITSIIYDMQARFNLNNLTTPETAANFLALLRQLAPQFSEEKAQQLVKALQDWIATKSDEGLLENQFNQYYLSCNPPYRAAHRPMQSVSELLKVKEMTPALFEALKPYVTVLPNAALINVQTAPEPVLISLNPLLSLANAKAIVELRKQHPVLSSKAFNELEPVKATQVDANKITVVSQYFLVETTVAVENQTMVLYTLLNRKDNKGEVSVLWQRRGVW